MTDVQTAPAAAPSHPGLVSRLAGVIFSPRSTYQAIASRPRALGAMVITIAIGCAIQFAFLSTEVGQNAMFERQLEGMERFGFEVTEQMARNMEAGLTRQRYFAAGGQAIGGPIVAAIAAGLVLMLFNALLDGNATFRQVYAVLAHAGVIIVLQQMFATPINYARGEIASPASLGVFVPMLDPDGFVGGFLGAVDLFFVWWIISLAIGLGVLYKRRTGPIAFSFFCVYGVIALAIGIF